MKRAAKLLLRFLPKSRFGDRLHHLAFFYVAHRRFPRRGSGLFNDYLFFLKTSDEIEDALRQFTSDKEFVKYWLAQRLGKELTPKTLKILSPDELAPGAVPNNCVAKPTHLSAIVAFARPKISDSDLLRLKQSMNNNIYDVSRERNYRNLKPKVICEEMIASPEQIIDYKIFCYRGKRRIVQIDVGRHSNHHRSLYSCEWLPIPVTYSKPCGPDIERPPRFGEMIELARTISSDFESVRVDLYVAGDKIVVGELTHCPEQAHGRFGSLAEERLFSEIYFGELRSTGA
jgi:hypothetical protein